MQQWGEESLAAIRRDFWNSQLYTEHMYNARRLTHPAFMWSAGVQLSALAAATKNNATVHQAELEEYARILKSYWHTHGDVGGYDVQPNATASDRYYDDNAWIVLALVETFEVTGKRQYLDDAIETFQFVLSGEDDKLDGGIYWRENEKNSKNTCVNAPAIVSALRIYQHNKVQSYLDKAQQLYKWTNSHLQDNETGLFFDNITLDGTIDVRKYSYNSALMIRANCLFHQITGEAKYLTEAQRIARASEQHWIDSKTGTIRDSGCFAHMLLEAFLAVHEQKHDLHWIEVSNRCVAFVHNSLRDDQGRYPEHWDAQRHDRRRRARLLDQASVARAYFEVSRALLPLRP